jgi:hypothetical protein
MDDVTNAAGDSSLERSHMTTLFQIGLAVAMILVIVLCYALLVIAKRQEAMLDLLVKQSGSMQETSVLINPETRSQAERHQNGSGR